MGSSGSGRFGNYLVGGGVSNNTNVGAGGNGIGSDGLGEITCPTVIVNIRLEDVATSEYYINNNSLPKVDSIVQLREKLYRGRLVVETYDTNEIIGNLPTQYNYLINCINKGINYIGSVVSSGSSPIPYVVVTLNA